MIDTARTHWILCGGMSHKDSLKDSLRLAVINEGVPGKGQFRIALGGLERQMLSNIPDVYLDLLEIAAYVYVADQAIFRGSPNRDDYGKLWRRNFRFVVPVRCIDFWSSPAIRRNLIPLLTFLSEDSYQFDFLAMTTRREHQLVLSGDGLTGTLADWSAIKSIILFSGGLDSLTGAYEELVSKGNDAILVSHNSATKMDPVRERLVERLRRQSGGNGRFHVSIKVERAKEGLDKERTQRSRSFLYAAIAATVAHMAKCRQIRFYENGVIALNVAISKQLYGAKATRTAHPRVLDGLTSLISLVEGHTVAVTNPFSEMTRTEVTLKLRDLGGKELFPLTRSCADITKSSASKPHCGSCSQCIDRRLAAVAADVYDLEPTSNYAVDLLRDELPSDTALLLAMDYVEAAKCWSEIRSDREFLAKHPELGDALPSLAECWAVSEDVALRRVADLHRRQGKAVQSAIAKLAHDLAGDWLNGRLPRGALVMVLFRHAESLSKELSADSTESERRQLEANGHSLEPNQYGGRPPPEIHVVELTKPLDQNVFKRLGQSYLIGIKGDVGILMTDSKALRQLAYLVRHPGESVAPLTLEAAAEGKRPPTLEPERDVTRAVGRREQIKIEKQLAQWRQDANEATENGDEAEAQSIAQQIRLVEEFSLRDTWGGNGKLIRAQAIVQARERTRKAFKRLLDEMRTDGPHIVAYLEKRLNIGQDVCFQDQDTEWRL